MNKLANLSRIAGVLAGLGTLSLTACGGDNSGSTEGFCDSLAKIEQNNIDPNDDFDGAMAALDDIKSNAPGELKDDLTTFIDVMTKINDAGEDASFDEFEEDFAKLTTSVETIQNYANENCDGLPDDIFN